MNTVLKLSVALALTLLAACGPDPNGGVAVGPGITSEDFAALRADPSAAADLARDFERLAFADPSYGKSHENRLTRARQPIIVGVGAAANPGRVATDRTILTATTNALRSGAGVNASLTGRMIIAPADFLGNEATAGTTFLATFMTKAELQEILTNLAQSGVMPMSMVAVLTEVGCASLDFSKDDTQDHWIFASLSNSNTEQAYCVNREIAGNLGLSGFLPRTDSIFSDRVRIATLSARDLVLVRMLYDPRLRPGMTAAQARPLLPAIAADALAP